MEGRGRNRLAIAGLTAAFATLIVPFAWLAALILGIVLIVRGQRRTGVIVLVLGNLLLPLIGAAIWQAVLVKPYRAPTESMSPALRPGDRFLVLRAGYRPEVGDIAVFHAPFNTVSDESCPGGGLGGAMCSVAARGRSGVDFVFRIVAGPGDRLRMKGGRLIRNGEPESGYEVRACHGDGCDFPQEIRVPDGHWYVLGDNRGEANDSRWWGAVPEDAFVGGYLVKYWSG